MIQSALIVAFIYWLFYNLDWGITSWQCLARPIVIGPVIGLALGDLQTGIIMGAGLESIFMGISAIGGSLPSDPQLATCMAVSYTIMTGADMEVGIALALPLGTILATIQTLASSVWAVMVPHWNKLAETNIKRFQGSMVLFNYFLMPLPNTIIVFLALAFGVEGLQSVMDSLPVWAMSGITAFSSMVIVVGFGILTSMIWTKELGCFFFAGYAMSAFLGLDALAVAVFGIVIAIAMFTSDKKLINVKNSLMESGAAVRVNSDIDDEEDFFQ